MARSNSKDWQSQTTERVKVNLEKHPCKTFSRKREGTGHVGTNNKRGVISKTVMDNKYIQK